jgi:hypothetical protein
MPNRLRFVVPPLIEDFISDVPGTPWPRRCAPPVFMSYWPSETILEAGEDCSPTIVIEGTARLNIASNGGRQSTLWLIGRGACCVA